MKASLFCLPALRALTTCLFLALAFNESGCVGPRYVNAKTRLESNYPRAANQRDFIWTFISDENLSGPDQRRADALRNGAFEYFADEEKDLDIFPAGATSGGVQVDLLAVSQRTSNSTFPNPTELRFQLRNITVGQSGTPTGNLVARFGEAGSSNAVEYASDTAGGFLDFEIFDIYRDRSGKAASGKFSAILRNKRDPTDRTALYIMDGSFIAGVRN